MAWLWKQGRPTLLAVVGAGVLGYKAFHRGRAPVGQGYAAVGVWDVPTAHPSLPTPAPAAAPTKTGFLGGLSVKELATRVMKEVREDDCLGWAAQLAYYLLFAVFPFFALFNRAAGLSAHPQLDGAHHRRAGHGPAGGGRHAPPGQYPAAGDGRRKAGCCPSGFWPRSGPPPVRLWPSRRP